MNGTSKPYGMIAEFTTAADVLHAAQEVRDHGCTRWDVFTPFPVHGMDQAMGLRNSKVGWFTFIGTFGLFFTFFLLFMRFLPMIAISEVKGVTPQSDPHHPLGGATEGGLH